MKLQKATCFALFAVLELAADPTRQLAAAEIAEKYGISLHHLAKVLRDLARAGVVESARGVGGGYRFAGNPKRLTLMDVIELFEPIETDGSSADDPRPVTDVGSRVACCARTRSTSTPSPRFARSPFPPC